MRTLACLLSAALLVGACSKDPTPPAAAAAPTPDQYTAAGERKVAINVTAKGYAPSRVPAKPGEKLILVFTRTDEKAGCASEIRLVGGPLKALPMNTPVELPVTAPASGNVTFACSMDGCHTGLVVAS
jgi:plastocyanin domain-containing protein